MLVSLILPTYKDIVALRLILDALELQTYKKFELLVVEDDDAQATKDFLHSYNSDFTIKHFFHADEGNRKAIIINKALPSVMGEYIIFIDGDTIPYSTFIESHVALSEKKTVLCGRRVNLGEQVSKDFREQKVIPYAIERHYLQSFSYLKQSKTRHYEQGLRLKPTSLLYKVLQRFDKNVHILGSNFSCFREDLFAINGFDEDIVGGSKDDVDLEWRFLRSGCRLKSCKFCANLFHLNHTRASRKEEEAIAKKMMQKNQEANKFICSNGIEKL